MPLVKEDSIAEDSTLSSSSPAPVKRAVHTYGRRQPTQVDESTSVANLESSTVRRQIYRTAPPDVDEEIPQSSSPSQESAPPRPKFEFSWKKMLRDMDKERPEDVAISSGSQDESNVFTSRDLDSSDPFRERDDASPSVPQALDAGSSSSPKLTHSRFSPAKSPIKSSLTHKQIKKRYGISASNLEEGPSSPITPEFPHCINTPKLSSSPTLPTSDEDRDLGSPAATQNESLDNDESVVPLRMEGISGPSQFAAVTSTRLAKSKSKSRKHSKIKVRCTLEFGVSIIQRQSQAPTKKELLETVKDRSRLAAAQQVSLPRTEEQKYTISNFFELLA